MTDQRIFHAETVHEQAQSAPSGAAPYKAIERILGDAMDLAVSNGANSISMPDYMVEVASWLSGIDAAPTQPSEAAQGVSEAPIDMILYCPACGKQHIDRSGEPVTDRILQGRDAPWANPPHRSHLCHGCGHIWRPADVATNGVREIKTEGKNDSPEIRPLQSTGRGE